MDEDEESVEVEDNDESVGKAVDDFPEEGIHEDCNWWRRSDRVVVQDVRRYAATCELYPGPSS